MSEEEITNTPDSQDQADTATAHQDEPELTREQRRYRKRKEYMREYQKKYQKKRNTGRPVGRPPKPKGPDQERAAQAKNHTAVWAPQYREDGTPGPQFALLSCPFPEIFFGGARGGGKALPLTEMVSTPTGYRAMGEIKVGDEVHGPNGVAIRVIGVYPQGMEDVFRITLVDGRTVRASRGHLWRMRVGMNELTVTTDYIRSLMDDRQEVSLPVESLDLWVSIKSIVYDGLALTQCIKVDSKDGLFVANDDIITHNTDGAIGKWLQHANRYGADAKGVFFRRRFKQLEEVQARCSSLFPPLGATYHKGDATWVFPNGAVLKLRHLWDVAATEEYQGHSYSWLCFEEITNWSTPDAINRMRATLRSAKGAPFELIMTGNPGGSGHCVPFGEVLTPTGWKDISQFEVGDRVMTVKEDGEMIPAFVSQTHRSHYKGPMVNVSARGLTMVCTPNHKVAKIGGLKKDLNKKFSLVPFENLPGQAYILRTVEWQGTPLEDIVPEYVPTRVRRLNQPKSLSGKLYCSVLGWLLSEGCTGDRDKSFAIAQMKTEQRETIRSLLEDQCGFSCSWSGTKVLVHCPDWWNHFRFMGKCRDKHIPEVVKNATKDELRCLFEALMDGDGTWGAKRESGQYFTISKQLADDVMEVALKLGYVVTMGQRERENRRGLHYTVYFKTVKTGASELLTGNHLYNVVTETKRKSDIEMMDFDGEVYCIGIPQTHSFVIRQNGSIWISGNSWVKSRFISPAPQGWTPIKDEETGELRIYIPSRLEDNTAMMKNDPTYAARLRGTGSAALVNAWLKGDWDIVAGGFFDDLIVPDIHFLTPFHIPTTWGYRRSFDWGSAAPASLGIWAVSDGNPVPDLDGFTFPRGSLIRIKEWYTVAKTKSGDIVPNEGLRLTNLALGEGIAHRSTGYRFSGCVADPSIYSKLGRESIYDEMRKGAAEGGHNLIMSPADNNRIGGWQKMRDMLENARADRPEKPGLWVFESCHHWLRTVPVLQRSETDFDDIDTTAEDHCLHGNTLVQTRDGDIKIRDLVGKVGEVIQVDGQYMIFWGCRQTRKNVQTVRVTTRDGRSVICTPEHLILTTERGWVEAENSLGDTLASGPTTLRPNEVDSLVVSVEEAGRNDVFNLEVEHTYALTVNNGLIVHNCGDDTRYVCMTGARQLKVGALVGR